MKRFSILFVAFAILFTAIWGLSRSRDIQLFGKIVSRVETKHKVVALTFDDGPFNEKYTNDVLKTLDSLDVKATFFLNGKGIEKNLQSAKKLVVAGHEIGNHSYNHERLIFKGLHKIENEVERTNSLIREIGFNGEIYFRPPYGKKLFTLPYYLSKEGILTVTWNIEPETHKDVSVSSELISEYVINQAEPGSIILLHVLGSKNEKSRNAIPRIVNELRSKGFSFVTVSELINKNA